MLRVALLRLSLVTEDQGIGRVFEVVSPHPGIHIQTPSGKGGIFKGYRTGNKQTKNSNDNKKAEDHS